MTDTTKENIGKVIPCTIEDEMKKSYIDYAMSVIIGRALPDVRDGLKPVHRRILFAMKEMGLSHNRPYKKSAAVVGDVLGKYHPHGDTAVYDTMVRLVQKFSMRHPLIDGQGNFGSIDGDSAAAYRYTEARLTELAAELLSDIDKETVDFTPNFDNTRQEPVVLPSAFPNLLVNGSSGIAVGMATNIPPHNLGEIIDGLFALIDNPDIEIKELNKIIKGPDFPAGGIIHGKNGIKEAYLNGRGSIKLRAKVDIEENSQGKETIIVKEIPYQVNKSSLVETIAKLVRDKKIEGISDLRDESDRKGTRVVIELKREAHSQIVLNQLFKHTQLETSFGIIMLSLVNNRPKVLNLKEMLYYYLQHRQEMVVRRTQFELKKAEARAHILEGLQIALDNLDEIVKIIRASNNVEAAKTALMEKFPLSKLQTEAILNMRLHQLTGLEREKIQREYLELIKIIEKFKFILSSPQKVLSIVKEELSAIKEKYQNKRRTSIVAKSIEMDIEDLIQEEETVITISHAGYVKRLSLSVYRAQHRGGKGLIGTTLRDEDFVENIFITSTHSYLLFFTTFGRVYWLKVYEIPEGSRQSKGKAIINLISLSSNEEKIAAAIPVKEFNLDTFLIMVTQNGTLKKTALTEYSNPRKKGIIAINFKTGDSLIDAKLSTGTNYIIIGTKKGMAIKFKDQEVKAIGRTGKGVRGIKLNKGDVVIGMETMSEDDTLLSVTSNGYGKRTRIKEYRLVSRACKGVINIKTTAKNGEVIGIKRVNKEDEIMLITAKGIVIREKIKNIRTIGRSTQGVKLIRLEKDDRLVGLAKIIPQGS
ncbi:DNA gyrase subunit A [bacterium]|nr:DNA gyrase subunit A [bacterium]